MMKNRALFLKHYSRLLTAAFEQMQSNAQAVDLKEVVDHFTENMTPDELMQVTEPLLAAILKSAEKFGKGHRNAIAWLFNKANILLPQLADKGVDVEMLENYGKEYLKYNPERSESDGEYYALRSTVRSLANNSHKNKFGISNILKSRPDFRKSYEAFFLTQAGSMALGEQTVSLPEILEKNILKILNLHNILGNKLFETDLSIEELDGFLKKYEPINKKYFSALSSLFKKSDSLDECAATLAEFSHYIELYAQLKFVKQVGELNVVQIYIGSDAPKGPMKLFEQLEQHVKSGATIDEAHNFLRYAVHEAYDEASKNSTLEKLANDQPLSETYDWCHEYRVEEVMKDDNYDLIVTMLAVKLHLEEQAVHRKLRESKDKYRNTLFGKSVEKPATPVVEVAEEKVESNNNDFETFLRKVM